MRANCHQPVNPVTTHVVNASMSQANAHNALSHIIFHKASVCNLAILGSTLMRITNVLLVYLLVKDAYLLINVLIAEVLMEKHTFSK